ncbi:hypothetical protein MRB53_003508 [Persea americana]|uniref:Uncharacterized protein n=1 Tax=Persea americana TaxID=3435 RepID=A0ACC2MXL9_PERAE|nr:hypothetical protein MRB53_003508 [Persea americana]
MGRILVPAMGLLASSHGHYMATSTLVALARSAPMGAMPHHYLRISAATFPSQRSRRPQTILTRRPFFLVLGGLGRCTRVRLMVAPSSSYHQACPL